MVTLDSPDAIRAFVGQSTTSTSMLVDQKMIDVFADLTHDHQWLHVDVARAATESPYGTTIAHGLLTLALLPAWYGQCLSFPNSRHGVNYGFDKVRFTGNKLADKVYYRHTGYPGGIKGVTAGKVLEGRFPERVLEKAVERMIPRGPLGRQQMRNLRIFKGAEHPHTAQNPEVLDIAGMNRKNKVGA